MEILYGNDASKDDAPCLKNEAEHEEMTVLAVYRAQQRSNIFRVRRRRHVPEFDREQSMPQ
jgi:hypothetical protein